MIEVGLGELADCEVEAVLRPIAADGMAATAVARRLEIAAGQEPAEQLRRFGELPVGSAVMTPGGALRAQYLIHLVVRSYDQPVTEDVVRRALDNGLRRLDEWGVESAALPLLGTGPGNLDPEISVAIVIPILLKSVRERPRRIIVLAESDYEYELLQRTLSRHSEPAGPSPGK